MPRKALVYGLLGLWSFVCLFPVFWLAVTSLKTEHDITSGPRYLPFVDFTPSLASWVFFLTDRYDNFIRQLMNSVVISLAATGLMLLAAAMAVYSFTRFRWRHGGPAVMAALMLTRMLPPIALAVPVYVLAQQVHLLDTRSLLVLVYTAVNLPVALWLLWPVLGSKTSDQEEAALLDGASHWRILFEVLLPTVIGGVAAAGIFIFVLCWNEYLLAAMLAGNEAMTLPPFLAGQMSIKEAQTGSEAEEWAHFSAAALMPALVFVGMAQRALGRANLNL